MAHRYLMYDFRRPKSENITYKVSEDNPFYGKIEAYPFERGYGLTIANSLRRVLLSSLPGYAISGISVKYYQNDEMKILSSEFVNIPGVYEDTIQFIQNLKRVRLSLLDGSIERKIYIELKGPREFKSSDLQIDSNIEIYNPDLVLATLNEDAYFNIEISVTFGRGYVPAEVIKEENNEFGFIAIDALYSPIEKVSYKIENYRIGQKIDYEKFIMEVWTDGSIKPSDAIADAAKILKEHFSTFINFDESKYEEEIVEEKEEKITPEDEKIWEVLATPVEELELNARAANCLEAINIKYIGELVQKTEDELKKVKNLGQKSLEEIIKKLEAFDLYLGMKLDEKYIKAIKELKEQEEE